LLIINSLSYKGYSTMNHTKVAFVTVLVLLSVLLGPIAAQEAPHYRIGYFLWFSTGGFKTEMAELGYIDGENITYLEPNLEGFETMAPEEAFASLQAQTQEILATQPDLIVTNTDTDAMNMRPNAGEIPIVFARSDDPVATGAVADLVNPGGNSTGVITNRPHERRLQILTEILPSTDAIYYLYSPLTGEGEAVLEQVRLVGEALGVEVIAAQTPDGPAGIEALQNTPEDADWLFLTPYVPFDFQFFEILNQISIDRQIGIAGVIDSLFPSYLMGYGPNIDASDAQAARMADLILRGASPANLPVQTAENYLSINLERAEMIGLEIPEGILRQASIIARPGYFESLAPPPGN
jgi:putative ABC transport system substrate-binding protein